MKKVTKAIIPAAGLGTRMLPISRAVPKEMLPIMDYPAIYYLVKEAADSGITDVLIITGRDKTPMEEFFDYSPEYDAALAKKGRDADRDARHAILPTSIFCGRKSRAGSDTPSCARRISSATSRLPCCTATTSSSARSPSPAS